MATTKWHYYVRRGELTQDALNEIGKEGWELVSVAPDRNDMVFYFKRPHPTLADTITLEHPEHYIEERGVGQSEVQ